MRHGQSSSFILFLEESDIDRVVAGEQGTFDKYLVALKRI